MNDIYLASVGAAFLAVTSCSGGGSTTGERAQASVGPDAVPASERPPATGEGGIMTAEPKYVTVFAFSNTTDGEPTTVSVRSTESYRECSLKMPGNVPMTMSEQASEIVCSIDPLGPDQLDLSVSYPIQKLAPRTADARMAPGPRPPTPEIVCTGTVCTSHVSSQSAYDPAPDFPHVQIDILSAQFEGEVQLQFTGNGRDLTIPVDLGTFDIYDTPYINVDEPSD